MNVSGKSLMSKGLVKHAAIAMVIAATGAVAGGGRGEGGGVEFPFGDAPPPGEVVVVREPVVYETYVVGYRRDLYDADLRVRLARADEWQAQEELTAARRHEGEIAVRLDE